MGSLTAAAVGLVILAGGLYWYRARRPGAAPAPVEPAPTPAPTPAPRWQPPPEAARYLLALETAERRHGIPAGMLVRLAYQESRFRPDIIRGDTVSSAGAVGLMQIVPRWHPEVNARDPFASIDYAARYLRRLHDRFGSWRWALAGYNWGPTVLAKKGIDAAPLETRNYVAQILNDVPAPPGGVWV